jgi:hypothetical protein
VPESAAINRCAQVGRRREADCAFGRQQRLQSCCRSIDEPLNDIRLVGDALKAVGFEVLRPAQNATRAGMLRAVHEFATKLGAAGPNAVGFLYYSRHGIASAGENYLIPVDVEEPSTVELEVQGVKNTEVLTILRNNAPNAAHYLVLDACRNNLHGAGGGRGFVPVGPQNGLLVRLLQSLC